MIPLKQRTGHMFAFGISTLLFAFPAMAESTENNVLHIYQDADLSRHIESSEAIQQGIEVAFAEVGNEVAGYNIEFKYLDHRGNVVRSKKNYQTFLADPKALAIYSGIHSPPLIANRSFINTHKALTMVPWAAGGPITRYPSKENWVFRLSIDDTRAGPVIINFAMTQKKCKSPHLLLEDTPWGESNLKNMSKALKSHGLSEPGVTRFGWGLSTQSARTLLRKIVESGSDCVVLVGNAIEGAKIASAMLEVPAEQRLPIISHWGITGGNFHEKIGATKRGGLDLSFIQSCFAFTNAKQTELSNNVFKQLTEHTNGKISKPADLTSAVGFIHAYDLTKLLIQAMKQATLSGDIAKDRDAVRLALENLHAPVDGLVKTYNKPFSVFDEEKNVNAHEALHGKHYCMGTYGANNEINIVE